jgi:arabinogalactan endo-1,4-beta-galactosidase
MKTIKFIVFVGLIFTMFSCVQEADKMFLGADLSYVNEMEDCGGVYRNEGKEVDPFELFADQGCGLVRTRLWNNPEWSGYSDYKDVEKTSRRARENGMKVLLDFHYSDTWADPHHQVIPDAWKDVADLEVLGDSLYNFTFKTLMDLSKKNLLPAFVQVGNETNIEILQQEDKMNVDTIDWKRNIFLLNKGIEAVHAVSEKTGKDIQIVIHIAQPENALWWFGEAETHGLSGYQWIGLSYYPLWSEYKLDEIPQAIKLLKDKFGKRVMIVETAYPFTFSNADSAGNILGEDALIPAYPATPQGQLDYMTDLVSLTKQGGGEGVIYWEPAWISTKCSTPWGQGSHWDNAVFFDASNGNEALPAFGFFNPKLYK